MRFAVRETLGVIMLALALLWSGGDLSWWPAWALIVVTAAWVIATAVVIIRHHPELMAERLGPRPGAKSWDTALMSLHGLLQLGVLILAGLDHRYSWTGGFPPGAQVAALLLCLLGYSMVVWATAVNTFFSQIVRVQTERDHHVITGGPYRYVRHPAYTGGFLTQICTPILLASWWALLIGIVDAALMILRTYLEDRTLQAQLPGYPEYAQKVRKLLFPYLW
jgi:protein-S-isoprenylcysteine O-methyltransferase Ste14